MKTVLILRHAKASDASEGGDAERPLKRRGRAEAPRIGALLAAREIVPERVVSSPARRARETAALAADAAGFDGEIDVEDSFYPGEPDDYVAALRALDDACDAVMVVGHNPGLEMLVDELTGRAVSLATATLAHITLPVDRWADLDACGDGTLVGVWAGRDLPDAP